jgi:hypothetical protein
MRHENKEEHKRIPRNVELKKMRTEVAENIDSIKDLGTVMTCYIRVVYIIYYRLSPFSKTFFRKDKRV